MLQTFQPFLETGRCLPSYIYMMGANIALRRSIRMGVTRLGRTGTFASFDRCKHCDAMPIRQSTNRTQARAAWDRWRRVRGRRAEDRLDDETCRRSRLDQPALSQVSLPGPTRHSTDFTTCVRAVTPQYIRPPSAFFPTNLGTHHEHELTNLNKTTVTRVVLLLSGLGVCQKAAISWLMSDNQKTTVVSPASSNLPNLNVMCGLWPPDGLFATLNKCNLLALLNHAVFLLNVVSY
jgi:hypothetical protein